MSSQRNTFEPDSLNGELVRLRNEMVGHDSVVLNQVDELIGLHDKQMRIIWANRAACESVDQTLAEIQGRHCYEIWADRAAPCEHCGLPAALREKKPQRFENTTPDGRHWLIHCTPLCNAEHEAVGIIEIALDISERKRTQLQLQVNEERFRRIIEQAHAGYFHLDADGRYTQVNRAWLKMHGYAEATEIRGRRFTVSVPADYRTELKTVVQRVLSGQPVPNGECARLHKDGTTGMNTYSLSPVYRQGEIVGVEGFLVDTTALRAAEKKLLEARRLEAIGNLAGGIAHDFNNLLTAVLGYANLLRLGAQKGDDVHEAACCIEEAAKKAAHLTRQLLAFSQRGKLRTIPIDVHAVIKNVFAGASQKLPHDVDVRLELNAAHATVLGEPLQLQRLVSNLVFNAAQSIDQKGTITIATCNQRQTAPAENLADASEAPQAPATEAGETAARLVIEVRDQGRGIPQPHLDKIFEPFFTTKAQAAGMGLPAVYGIAKSHGGDVEVESTVGRGSCFRVQLPAASTAAQTSDEHPVYKDPRTTPTVLVVDDEPQVRQVLARLLSSLGYPVATASTGHEALQVYQARREEIGLVILDMVMPAMNGDECFRRLKAIDPDVKTLLATGHTEDQKVQRLLDEGVQGFLPKPFTHKRISAAVHNVLHVE